MRALVVEGRINLRAQHIVAIDRCRHCPSRLKSFIGSAEITDNTLPRLVCKDAPAQRRLAMQTLFSARFKSVCFESVRLRSLSLKMIFVLCCSSALPGMAQQTVSPTSQDEINQQLLDRIQELEK